MKARPATTSMFRMTGISVTPAGRIVTSSMAVPILRFMPSPMDRFLLTDQVALVTGGSRGLGREMVLAFAAAGADVVITSRKLEPCQALAEEVEKTTGRKALAYASHVGDWNQLDGLVDAAYERFGKV